VVPIYYEYYLITYFHFLKRVTLQFNSALGIHFIFLKLIFLVQEIYDLIVLQVTNLLFSLKSQALNEDLSYLTS